MSTARREFLLKFLKEAKSYLAVVFLQFGYAGSAIITKTALNQGMSHYTFSVYRNAFAALVFAPFAIILERKIRSKMNISTFFKIMLLGLLEPVIDQNLYYAGMKYTTASFATAMCNVLPAITFLLAWILRVEKVNIRKIHSQAKIMGTIVTIGGAMIMTLVGGPTIGLPWTKPNVPSTLAASPTELNPVKGALFIFVGCLGCACFYNLQAITLLKTYPAGLSLTSLICMAGALQGTVLTLVVERGNPAAWSINWGSKLFAFVYCGIVNSGIGYYFSGLIMEVKGPVFVTSFNPLNMVIVAILGSFILSEQLNMGRVLGAAVIVIELYLVIWGTIKVQKSSKILSIVDEIPEPVDNKELVVIKFSNQTVISGDEFA